MKRVVDFVKVLTGPWTWRNAQGWITIILLILVIRWTGCEPNSIPSGSMEPTLKGDLRLWRGDRVAVNKLVYGPRIPFTTKRIFHLYEPQRWDIVIFRTVEKNAQHPTLVKRVVGLPGERIHIADGKICVNGKPIEPPEALRGVLYYTDKLSRTDDAVKTFVLYLAKNVPRPADLNPSHQGAQALLIDLDRLHKTLGNTNPETLSPGERDALLKDVGKLSMEVARELYEKKQTELYPLQYGIRTEDEYAVVPADCYLVCGDNSGDSLDGRYFGWLPNGHIVGRAFCIWWPISRWRDLTGFSKTWWGMGLLYGIPMFLITYESVVFFRRRRKALR